MIATFAAYVGLALESFIVDTDHWRQYYLLVGMIWGMFAATVNFTREHRPAERTRNRNPEQPPRLSLT